MVDEKSKAVVLQKHSESKQGSSVRVERLQLSKAGTWLLTTRVGSISEGASEKRPADKDRNRTGTHG
jgi:hypothetical protein